MTEATTAIILMLNFYSHAREGRDWLLTLSYLDTGISTHTPARGVTYVNFTFIYDINISTHTPARGVTSRRY